jgi:hypothetical protein
VRNCLKLPVAGMQFEVSDNASDREKAVLLSPSRSAEYMGTRNNQLTAGTTPAPEQDEAGVQQVLIG